MAIDANSPLFRVPKPVAVSLFVLSIVTTVGLFYLDFQARSVNAPLLTAKACSGTPISGYTYNDWPQYFHLFLWSLLLTGAAASWLIVSREYGKAPVYLPWLIAVTTIAISAILFFFDAVSPNCGKYTYGAYAWTAICLLIAFLASNAFYYATKQNDPPQGVRVSEVEKAPDSPAKTNLAQPTAGPQGAPRNES